MRRDIAAAEGAEPEPPELPRKVPSERRAHD
jgi:hypothetical protein